MKTDKLVYLLLQLAPQSFFSLIGRDETEAEHYDFKSVELKETSFRLDGVFVPKNQADFTYFVEAQFQPDEDFYARFFAEVFLYLKQYRVKKWRAVAIYPSRSVEQRSIEGYDELLETGLVLRVYLDELPEQESVSKNVGLFKLLVAPEAKAPSIAKRLIQNATLKQVDLIEQIVSYKFSKLTREEVKAMLGIQEELLKETQFYKDIYNDIYNQLRKEIYDLAQKEGLKEGREQGLKKGFEKGIVEGRLEGEIQGKLSAVPNLRKLGLSDEAIAEALNLSLELVKNT
ncbi:MAG: Rpn family recombination-promoting nuclease/putative transposase, partial [Chloroherpetonaceae bacterium]